MPRPRLVPGLYAFFIVNLAIFAFAFGRYGAEGATGARWARAFYVWVTVFNMFAVSVFWSSMAEVWSEPQGRRFFGMVSAGGSLGGLIGPLLASLFVAHVAVSGLIWISTALLAGASLALGVLLRRSPAIAAASTKAGETTAGKTFEGLKLIGRTPFLTGIAVLVSLGSFLGMIVYIEMARLVATAFANAAERTTYYSSRVPSLRHGFGVDPVADRSSRREPCGLGLDCRGDDCRAHHGRCIRRTRLPAPRREIAVGERPLALSDYLREPYQGKASATAREPRQAITRLVDC